MHKDGGCLFTWYKNACTFLTAACSAVCTVVAARLLVLHDARKVCKIEALFLCGHSMDYFPSKACCIAIG